MARQSRQAGKKRVTIIKWPWPALISLTPQACQASQPVTNTTLCIHWSQHTASMLARPHQREPLQMAQPEGPKQGGNYNCRQEAELDWTRAGFPNLLERLRESSSSILFLNNTLFLFTPQVHCSIYCVNRYIS